MFSEQKGGVSWEHIPKKTNEWSSRLELSLEPVDFVNLDLPPFAGLQELQHPATAHMMLSQKNMWTSVMRIPRLVVPIEIGFRALRIPILSRGNTVEDELALELDDTPETTTGTTFFELHIIYFPILGQMCLLTIAPLVSITVFFAELAK